MDINGIVLAGGKSSRFGRNKALAQLDGESLVCRVAAVLKTLSKEIYLVLSQDSDLQCSEDLRFEAKVVRDKYKAKGPLVGIYSGLAASSELYNYAVACDMPLVGGRVLAYMASVAEGHDVVVPRIDGELEPLCAIYSKMCIPVMEEMIFEGKLRTRSLFEDKRLKVRYVEREEIEKLDPESTNFLNVNTEDDLEWVRSINRSS